MSGHRRTPSGGVSFGGLAPSRGKSSGKDATERMMAERASLAEKSYKDKEVASAPKTEAVFQGWLTKRAVTGLVKNWKRRYFVLLDDEMRWYENAEVNAETGDAFIKGLPLGQLTINEMTTLLADTEMADRTFVFTLVTGQKQLVLQAEDGASKNSWLAVLSGRVKNEEAPRLRTSVSFVDSSSKAVDVDDEAEEAVAGVAEGLWSRVAEQAASAPKQEAAFQGWLTKRAVTGLVKNWKLRYFVLIDGELRWYSHADVNPESGESFIKGSPLGSLPVSEETTLIPETDMADRSFVFTLVSSEKQLVLQAPDAATRQAWLSVLCGRTGESPAQVPGLARGPSMVSIVEAEDGEDDAADAAEVAEPLSKETLEDARATLAALTVTTL